MSARIMQTIVRLFALTAISLLAITLSACELNATSTPFIAPTKQAAAPQASSPTPPPVTFAPQATSKLPQETPTPESLHTAVPTEAGPCNNSLLFVQDITVEDGTIFAPGEAIDKRWLVANVGSCNWDTRYRLRLTNGIDLGAAAEQALYPARAGTQAVIRIEFVAPDTPGLYRSEWQAYGPDGTAFGNPIYVEIVVQTP